MKFNEKEIMMLTKIGYKVNTGCITAFKGEGSIAHYNKEWISTMCRKNIDGKIYYCRQYERRSESGSEYDYFMQGYDYVNLEEEYAKALEWARTKFWARWKNASHIALLVKIADFCDEWGENP